MRFFPIVFISTLSLFQCSPKTPSEVVDQTPNIRIINAPYELVWTKTNEVVEYEFLMSMEFRDIEKGVFSTKMIRENTGGFTKRFRVSGSMVFNGKQTMVKLYKHEEIFENQKWRAVSSDYQLESKILDQITQKIVPTANGKK